MPNIDRKYKILAVNPCSLNIHTQNDSVLFLAKDRALPETIEFYRDKCIELGSNPAHIESVNLLHQRVIDYQLTEAIKTPDTDLPCEIDRCVNGIGVDEVDDIKAGELSECLMNIANSLTAAYRVITDLLPPPMTIVVVNEANGLPEEYAQVLDPMLDPIGDLYKLAKLLNPQSEV